MAEPRERLSKRERMKIERQKMPEQEPDIRNSNFGEVNLGLSESFALLEAERCLECRDPKCVQGCPVNVNIPNFIQLLAVGDRVGAAKSLLGDNALPAITGRVCPQETQCECLCIRGNKGTPVAVGYLERFVADWAREHRDELPVEKAPPTGRTVAIVGSGPGGLTAAGELAAMGHDVTVFEALHRPGGVLVYGIPEFRLPKNIVDQEVDRLKSMGVKIECNVIVGRTYGLDELRETFDSVFIANGAGLPVFMNVPGENYKGVYSANEYLTRINLMSAYKRDQGETPVLVGNRVAVVGGGNVAMDSVRTAKRMGADNAMIVYRRSRDELPARVEEVNHAEEEGIDFEMLVAPVEVLADENRWVRALKCVRMELGEPDESGRRRPRPIEGSEFELECDVVVVAIGSRANPLLTSTCPDLKLNKRGNIEVDDSGMTSLPGVFAGGDIVRGAATVILAMGDGKNAAKAIDNWLKENPASKQTEIASAQ